MMKLLKRFITDESGSTAVEYALLAVGIGLTFFSSQQAAGAVTSGIMGTAVAKLSMIVH